MSSGSQRARLSPGVEEEVLQRKARNERNERWKIRCKCTPWHETNMTGWKKATASIWWIVFLKPFRVSSNMAESLTSTYDFKRDVPSSQKITL